MVDILPPSPGHRSVPALSATSDAPGAEPPATPAAKALELNPAAPPEAAPGAPVEPTDASPATPKTATETPAEAEEGGKAEAAADGGEGDAAEPEAGDAGKKPRPSINERFSEYARRTREANERADKLAAIAEQAVAALQKFTPAQQEAPRTPEPPAPEPRPQRHAFDDPDSFEGALIEWAARNSAAQAAQVAAAEFAARQQAERETNERQRSETEARERQDAVETVWNDRVAKAADRFPDFDDVARREDVRISYPMRDAIKADENGPAIAYHLGSNPSEAERIAKLPIIEQFVAIGRLSAQLAEPAAPQVTRMPAPPRPVGSNSAARAKVPSQMSTDEYAEHRMKTLQAERRAGMFGMRGGG